MFSLKCMLPLREGGGIRTHICKNGASRGWREGKGEADGWKQGFSVMPFCIVVAFNSVNILPINNNNKKIPKT